MAIARVVEGLVLRAANRIGLLADVAEEMAGQGVDILAIGAYEKAGQGEFRLVTSDNEAVADIAVEFGASVEREDVVMVDLAERPGALAEVAGRLAVDGVDIEWLYATTGDGTATIAVIKTGDPSRTADLLNA